MHRQQEPREPATRTPSTATATEASESIRLQGGLLSSPRTDDKIEPVVSIILKQPNIPLIPD